MKKKAATKRTTPARQKPAATRHIGRSELAPVAEPSPLFDRVASILDEARANVVRAVNSQMVLAYWLIGREIVHEIQGGEERAAYGRQVLKDLSRRLTERYGRGFSVTNLQNFRQFHLTYARRVPEIHQTVSVKSKSPPIHQTASVKLASSSEPQALGVLRDLQAAVDFVDESQGFSPQLSWSHYQLLLQVEHRGERCFYEIEAAKEGWTVRQLERQIHTFLFARLLKSRDKEALMALATQGQQVLQPIDAIKNPYVLDFLDLPESGVLHESKLESAIISNLQTFLLELGKGFAFMARQKRVDFDGDFFYIDLVFYHTILKCHVLIDLKIGKLTHQDVGQMDGYVRMFDDLHLCEGDNPTIGLILCTEKNEAVAKYSVLKDRQQIFASKYMLHLPTEEELSRELLRERRLIEEQAARKEGGV
jgi:predicted nuclease of restriction endonuclease-like (RecB) superfamily